MKQGTLRLASKMPFYFGNTSFISLLYIVQLPWVLKAVFTVLSLSTSRISRGRSLLGVCSPKQVLEASCDPPLSVMAANHNRDAGKQRCHIHVPLDPDILQRIADI